TLGLPRARPGPACGPGRPPQRRRSAGCCEDHAGPLDSVANCALPTLVALADDACVSPAYSGQSGREREVGMSTKQHIPHARATRAKVAGGHNAQAAHTADTPSGVATIATVTAIPGPRSQALDAARERYLPRGIYTYHHIYPAAAAGARITDVDGNAYLDFAGGIGTLN